MGLRDITFFRMLEYNADRFGSAPAVIGADQIISHEESLDRVNKLAAGLQDNGIEKGDRICILAQNCLEYFDLYGACAKIGAIAYPINWRLTSQEVAGVIELADPSMLAVGVENTSQIEDLELDELKVGAVIGKGLFEEFMPFSDLYMDAVGSIEEVGIEDPFVVISTAAVEGVPRGAVLTHLNTILGGYQLVAAMELSPRDRHLAALPLFHITGLGLSFAVLQAGGANVVMESFDPAAAVGLMDEHGVTLMADFPPILAMLLDAKEASGA
ncbi:MAG: AMP-binding protein, partial [Anaerolineales bacterium]|nr:AMP-binding protein [Anaerolineales bacterium]